MATLPSAAKEAWKKVEVCAKNAVVYLDASAAELLHWAGGINLISSCYCILDLFATDNQTMLDLKGHPIVIVINNVLSTGHRSKMSTVLSRLQPSECHVFCSVPDVIRTKATPPVSKESQSSSYTELNSLIRRWINREDGVKVSVRHVPLFHASVCSGLFITPPCCKLQPLIPSDLEKINSLVIAEENEAGYSADHLSKLTFDMLPQQMQERITVFVTGLSSLLNQLEMSEDLFSFGPTSRLIANKLASLEQSHERQKLQNQMDKTLFANPVTTDQTAASKCSVILVDRSLDFVAATTQACQTLADKIFGLLPRLPQHSVDVAVDMTLLTDTPDKQVLIPGSLAQQYNNQKGKMLLNSFITMKPKEALMEVSRALLDALKAEKILAQQKPGKMASAQVKTFIESFKGHPNAMHSQLGVIQLACAALEALDHKGNHHRDKIYATEKILVNSVGGSGPSPIKQLTELMSQEQTETNDNLEAKMNMADVICLAVHLYSLVGKQCTSGISEDMRFQSALEELALKEDKQIVQQLGLEGSVTQENVRKWAVEMVTRLRSLAQIRDDMKQFKSLHKTGITGATYHPILTQLLEAVFSPHRPDLTDLQFHAEGLTNKLKATFSLFMSSALPRPATNDCILLFVIGGITSAEVRQIRETVTKHSTTNKQVLIGSTSLLTPLDTVLSFCNRRL